MDFNPHNIPKIRSDILRRSAIEIPCNLRISSFIPGHTCSSQSTNVMCHLPVFGKGHNTKVSDMFMACGCQHCHDLLDGRDRRIEYIIEKHAAAYNERLLHAYCETLGWWQFLELVTFPNEGVKH